MQSRPARILAEAQALLNEVGIEAFTIIGRYLDRFLLHEDAWLIAERRVVIDFSTPLSGGEEWPSAAGFLRGARREADPSASLFA